MSTLRWMFAMIALVAMTVAPAIAARAQTANADDQTAFGFDLAPTESHRGLGVQGYLYNPLPWRITNVRVQVDSIDGNGALLASASGGVIGDVDPGRRGYFYVPISAPAATYRASVRAFDRVAGQSGPQAP